MFSSFYGMVAVIARSPRVVIVDVAHHVTQRANGRFEVAESRAGERENRKNPPGDPKESAVWLGAMGVRSGSAVRAGKHHAQPGEAEKRLLTPFVSTAYNEW